MFEASRLDDVVEQVVRSLEFSVLAKYAFGLAQLFNAFYHRYPILNEERADRKRWRAAGVAYVRHAADARARSDGHRSAEPDVTAWPIIGITPCRKLEDYRQAILHVGGEVAHPRSVDDASTRRSAGIDGLLLTGGDDVAPARYGEAGASDGRSKPSPGATSSRSR